MVKADLTRDYYGDLEISPTADLAEIKKQFKRLALSYHPDRNPGREAEVTAKFQRIQSAHEVLSDPNERAKYDSNRITSRPNGYKTAYQGASGVRGNPWANAGAQWAPPPKPPGAKRPPPPSAGAKRYGKFETPKTSANSANEGPEASRKAYEAWEHMRSRDSRASRESYQPPPPSRDYTNTSGRDESNSYKHPPPPKPKPGFDEYRAKYSPNVDPHKRAQSTGASNRRGFVPATPGGDEPAAPKGAYFTQHKSQYAPEPPPRVPPPSTNHAQEEQYSQNIQPDPLKQFRQQVDPAAYESRQSTPYQTHGGEKLNPFDNIHLNRSKSHRERSDRPETAPDPNLSQPHRSRSFADRLSRKSKSFEEAINSSSSDGGPEIPLTNSRKFAQPKRTPTGPPEDGQRVSEATEHSRKPSLSTFQQWYWENQKAEPPLNNLPSDGPSTGAGPANARKEEPSMYGNLQSHSVYSKKFPSTQVNAGNRQRSPLLEVESSEHINPGISSASYFPRKACKKYSFLSPEIDAEPAKLPSGVAAQRLNPFEADQRRILDQLIDRRNCNYPNANSPGNCTGNSAPTPRNESDKAVFEIYQDLGMNNLGAQGPATMGSSTNEQRSHELSHLHHAQSFQICRDHHKLNANKNNCPSRFFFKVDDNTFATTSAPKNGITNASTENINTKFTPEEWEGKFEAGHDYFKPEQKSANAPQRGRTQSASRARGRSPVKVRPVDPQVMQPRVEDDAPVESPGGTKFTPEEWAQSFKPQTFMPPPPAMPPRPAGARKSRGTRPTMGGNAAAVDDSDTTSDEKPLFAGRRPQPPPILTSPALDPMDVDSTPPAETAEIQATEHPAVNTVPLGVQSPSKRPAAPSQSPTDSALKVEFDDLKLRDLISHLNLPAAPIPPELPRNLTPEYNRPAKEYYAGYLKDFQSYMCDWDLFSNRFMFHILARKKLNDGMGAMRWQDDAGLEKYRMGLKEDKVVLDYWSAMQEKHELVMKDYAILKEQMKPEKERDRPRKKTH